MKYGYLSRVINKRKLVLYIKKDIPLFVSEFGISFYKKLRNCEESSIWDLITIGGMEKWVNYLR